jgi:hypothetical protein
MAIVQQLSLVDDGKVCTKCGKWKPLPDFIKNSMYRGGITPQCRTCKNARSAQRQAEKRAEDPERFKREYAEWYAKRGLEYSRKWNNENRAAVNANKRARRKENGNHDTIMGISRRRGAEGSFTSHEWKALCARYGNRCLICQGKVKLTRDHIVPVKDGGTNYLWNIQCVCGSCNSRKQAKHLNCRPDRLLPAYSPL